jgi:hypothetical protein
MAALAEATAAREAPTASFTLEGMRIERLAPRDGRFGWSVGGTIRLPGVLRPTPFALFRGVHGEP